MYSENLSKNYSKYLIGIFILLFFQMGFSQKRFQEESYEHLIDYLDNHSKNDSQFFPYLEALDAKAKKDQNLEHIYSAKSKFIVHSTHVEDKLIHAYELLSISKEHNNLKYIGLAYNKLAFVYYMERNFEESLKYELLAEEYLSQTEDEYDLNKSRYGIGVIYYFLGNYEKSLTFFRQARSYYASNQSYNHLRGYISTLQYMAKNYLALDKLDRVAEKIDQLEAVLPSLKNHHLVIEQAYLDLLKSQWYSKSKDYKLSLRYLNKALQIIESNDDFVNTHLAYLYLGINHYKLKQFDSALMYLKKIDDLYITRNYSDLHLLEAYNYLIEFYREKSDLKNQLYYTEQLLHITHRLQWKNKGLADILHVKYETKKIESNRLKLKQELEKQKKKRNIILIFSSIVVISLALYIFLSRRKEIYLRTKYEELQQDYLLQQKQTYHKTQNFVKKSTSTHVELSKNATDDTKKDEIEKKILSKDKTSEILEKLDQFEKERRFLNGNITLISLAKELETNTKYLSEVINVEKKFNFTAYINQLRIQYAINELNQNPKLRKYTISALAKEFGFSSARSFSDAFFKQTGIKPSYYLSQLILNKKETSP